MKPDALKKQLKRDGKALPQEDRKAFPQENRPMTTVTVRMPEDVIEDLKWIALILGFSGYQPLARTYIGQGLRSDLERLENDTVSSLSDSLKRHGVEDDVIQEALNEVVNG